ncbi:hypothetical protein V8C86DRAFT_1251193 [Haematococcus lacustris]
MRMYGHSYSPTYCTHVSSAQAWRMIHDPCVLAAQRCCNIPDCFVEISVLVIRISYTNTHNSRHGKHRTACLAKLMSEGWVSSVLYDGMRSSLAGKRLDHRRCPPSYPMQCMQIVSRDMQALLIAHFMMTMTRHSALYCQTAHLQQLGQYCNKLWWLSMAEPVTLTPPTPGYSCVLLVLHPPLLLPSYPPCDEHVVLNAACI